MAFISLLEKSLLCFSRGTRLHTRGRLHTHARTHVDAVPHIRHLCKIGGGGGRQCKSEENHLCPALNLSRCWIQSPRGKKPLNVLCDIIGGEGDRFLVNSHIAPHTRVFIDLITFIPKVSWDTSADGPMFLNATRAWKLILQ